MSRLTDLLRQARKTDPQLAGDLEKEIAALARRRTFGLVFERHRPEAVELPGRPVRRGDKVYILPPRGATSRGDQRLWRVQRTERVDGVRMAHLTEVKPAADSGPEATAALASDLVVVADSRDRLYPGLVETGRIDRGPVDTPAHTVINGENLHVLKALTYTHRGKVDAIYIDPPYNTGARDWKYNNDYVEADDDYRHSKWLAFMERRLIVARELLNPQDSVLIVTIDEKEYLRLGLLLEQTFPEARIQMVSTVINPKGATRASAFGRTDEYIYFVMFGSASPAAQSLSVEWKVVRDARSERLRWAELLRAGTNAKRSDRPNQFYPVFLRNTDDGPIFDSIGNAYYGNDRAEVKAPDDCVAIWPIRSDGTEGNWQVGVEAVRTLINAGYTRIGPWRAERTSISYLKRGEQQKVRNGVFPLLGRRADNSVIVDEGGYSPVFVPGTQWRISSHEAGGSGGSGLLRTLIPDRRFPFPKSLYAVEDAVRFFVSDKPQAVILDFFSGSGTTVHAVMRLNRQDGGRRQCISVTNNEVGVEEQKKLRADGLRPGDQAWEQWGICEHITKPRIEAAITGLTPMGETADGGYKFTDEFPVGEGFEASARFFTLTYEAPLPVRHHRAFARIAPMLWLRAGAKGEVIESLPEHGWDVAEAYGVLAKLDYAAEFVRAVAEAGCVETAFIVTDDESAFQMVCRELPGTATPVRLYESYLQNFGIGGDT